MRKLLALAVAITALSPAAPALAALDLTAAYAVESTASELARSAPIAMSADSRTAAPREPNATASQLPEPMSWALLLGGFALLGVMLRLRNRGASNSAV